MATASYVLKKRPDGKFDLVPRAELSAWIEAHYPDRMKGTKIKIKPVERGSWVWRDGKLIDRNLAPPRMHRGSGLQVIKDSEPFLNIAVDNGYIGGRRQRRDMMRAHGLEEVGNDPPVNRKQETPFNTRQFAEDVKQAARQHGVDWL